MPNFHSYEEVLNTLDLVIRLGMDAPVLNTADPLVYPVLTRDRQAMADLVRTTLGPLLHTRGGAQTSLDTLTTYFDTGCNAAETARRLSLSVRALTYRLQRIHQLTHANPTDPTNPTTATPSRQLSSEHACSTGPNTASDPEHRPRHQHHPDPTTAPDTVLDPVPPVRAARNSALAALAADLPSPILADLTGMHRHTAIRWVAYARRDWAEYLAARAEDQQEGRR
ncbi:hypothetical protein EES42_36420 [Streptomyces sp. ADI95-17]|nr:hypothetical protein EES42_36420 [Streptomyces sp. ADI95-17]